LQAKSGAKAGTTGTDWNGNWNGNRALRYQKQGMFQCSNIFNKKMYGREKRKEIGGKRIYRKQIGETGTLEQASGKQV
jgi:hypothetical protein